MKKWARTAIEKAASAAAIVPGPIFDSGRVAWIRGDDKR